MKVWRVRFRAWDESSELIVVSPFDRIIAMVAGFCSVEESKIELTKVTLIGEECVIDKEATR